MWTQRRDWLEDPAQWGIEALRADVDDKDNLLKLPGLSRDPELVHTGRNSGYAAVNLAYHLGAERIILLGFDMGNTGGRRHFFGDHPPKMNADSPFHEFIMAFQTIDPAEYGLEIWNCSRKTTMNHFPIYDFDEIMARL